MATKSKTRLKQERELNNDILRVSGFMIDSNTCNVLDEETFESVVLNGKNMRYSPDGKSHALYHSDAIFNPIENRKQAGDLFKLFLSKEEEENGFYCKTFYDKRDKEDEQKASIEMRTDEGIFQSDYYYNESLRYIDLMMKISNYDSNIDLHKLDFRPKPTKKRG